jgi:hypothetical protein
VTLPLAVAIVESKNGQVTVTLPLKVPPEPEFVWPLTHLTVNELVNAPEKLFKKRPASRTRIDDFMANTSGND